MSPAGEPVQIVVRRPAELVIRAVDVNGRGLHAHGDGLELLEPGPGDRPPIPLHDEGRRLTWAGREDLLVEVTVHAGGHLPRRLVSRLPVAPIDVRLEAGTGTVHGVVVDQAGQPLPGASVMLEWADPPAPAPPSSVRRGDVLVLPGTFDRQLQATDADGAFTFDGLPAGTRFTVEAGSYEFVPDRRSDVADGAVLKFVLTPRPPYAPAAIHFRARCAESGAPVPELRLRSIDNFVKVVPEGADGVTLKQAGDHRVQLEAPDRMPSAVFEIEAVLGSTVDLGEIALARAGSVRLEIRNWPAAPIAQLRARWRDPDGRAREASSTPAAEWLLEGLAPGRVTLEVEAWAPDGSIVRRVELVVAVRVGEVTAAGVDLRG